MIKQNLIQKHIDNNDVCLFMKDSDAPQCGFSIAVSNMLKILEVNYKGINVLEDQSLRGIKVLMIGLLYLNYMLKKNLLVAVILSKMYESGELKVFDDKGINYKK